MEKELLMKEYKRVDTQILKSSKETLIAVRRKYKFGLYGMTRMVEMVGERYCQVNKANKWMAVGKKNQFAK